MLIDKIEVLVYDDEKLVHRSEFRCKSCNSRLKKTNIHRLKAATCPVCHSKDFNIDYNQKSLWD
jgi:Zn finger protein HypA/HybF involved in hydrogenase expression